MRISKLLPLIGIIAFCANISVGADDNAAQAAARAALMQKMNDLDSQQNEPSSNPPSAPAPVETQPATPPPSSEPVAPSATAEPPPPPVEVAPVAPEVQPAVPAPVPAQPETVAPSAPVVAAPLSVTNSVNPSEPPLNVEAQNAQPT